MNDHRWTHVLGNTWCIELRVTIPVYFLSQKEVVLLDTGFPEDRGDILQLLQEKNLHVRAILGSHGHNDHCGSHVYLQENQRSEIILQQTEAAIVSDFSLLTASYAPATAADLKEELPHMRIQADRTFTAGERTLSIDGAVFQLVPLPGHTPGHTGVITPDGVFYVADAILNEATLRRAKLPSTLDWSMDLESKRQLLSDTHPAYILAHRGVQSEIRELAQQNISDRLARAEQIAGWLAEAGSLPLSGLEKLLWKKLNVHTGHFLSQTVFRRNVFCAINYLVQSGVAQQFFKDGTMYYEVNDPSGTYFSSKGG